MEAVGLTTLSLSVPFFFSGLFFFGRSLPFWRFCFSLIEARAGGNKFGVPLFFLRKRAPPKKLGGDVAFLRPSPAFLF